MSARRYEPVPPERNRGFGLAALVLGIVGVAVSWLCYLGLPFAVVAIVFGALGRRTTDRGSAEDRTMATAGLVLGIVGVVLTVVVAIWLVVVLRAT